jgi:hypothetical protein
MHHTTIGQAVIRPKSVLLGGFQGAGEILFQPHVDLQAIQEVGLMRRQVLEEGRGVQRRRSRLGIEYPVGQRLFMQPTDLRILEDDIENPLGQGFVHKCLLLSFELAAL